MKKLIAMLVLTLGVMSGVASAQWQDRRHDRYDRDRYEQQDRYGRYNDDYRWDRNRVITRNEYRYVRYGRRVYKETYRSTYMVRNRRNGSQQIRLVSRVLVDRDEVRDYNRYDRYGRNRNGIRFNVYLPF